MSTAGPNLAGTGADDAAVGTIAWANPGNITIEDANPSTATMTSSTTSHYLKATNFGFSIPDDATIDGITVEFKRSRGGGTPAVKDSAIRIVKGGAISTTNLSAAAEWSTVLGWISFGGVSNLWGETWTPDDINASTFGVVLSCSLAASKLSKLANVDAVRITITYTEAAGGGGVCVSAFSSRVGQIGMGVMKA